MSAKKKEIKPKEYIVKSEFRSIHDFDQIHEVGDDVSDFEPERLKKLLELGLIEKVKDESAAPVNS